MAFKWTTGDTDAVLGVAGALGIVIAERYMPLASKFGKMGEAVVGALLLGVGVYLDGKVAPVLVGAGLGELAKAAGVV